MTNLDTRKKDLERELEELEEKLKTIGIHDPRNTRNWVATPEGVNIHEPDPNTAADRVEQWDGRRGTIALLEHRYNNLLRALQKLDEGTYGICEIGGETIEADRLDANPAARTCKAHLDEEDTLSIY